MRLSVFSVTIAAFVIYPFMTALAADADPALLARIEKEIVPKLVKTIGILGHGKTEAAIDSLHEFIDQPLKKKGPFAGADRQSWRRMFEFFEKAKPIFESVDLMEIRAISNKAYRISLIGNGKHGPALFHYRMYEYQGKIRLANIHFDTNWNRIELHIATIRNKRYTRYTLPALQTAKRKKAAKRK